MKSMYKTSQSVERKPAQVKSKQTEKSVNKGRKPIRITINLQDDFESNVILSTDHTYKYDTLRPIEIKCYNDPLNTTVNKSGLNHFNILTTKYMKIEEKLKKLSKEISLNDSVKAKCKNNSMSVNKSQQRINNLSYMNATMKYNTKKKSSNIRRKDYENMVTILLPQEKAKLNFSIESKDAYGVLTPKINKNKSVKKEIVFLNSEKNKVKKLDYFNGSDHKTIIQKYQNVLNSQEIDELSRIHDVYYLGKIALRQLVENSTLCNEEIYTEDSGNFIVNIGEHINYRYEILSEIGNGSFGQAVKCYDHKEKVICCLKIIKNNTDYISQAESEINILNYIKKAELQDKTNIVEYYENFIFRNHICIKFEILDLNLYEFLKEREFIGMDEISIRKIIKQVLYALVYMKRHNIIHCDLKPENILFKNMDKLEVKVIDFGSSCFTNEKSFTYIQSRFYRAPEVILENEYNTEIDMWSLGCIVAELYNGYPIFPGESEVDQFNYFLQYLGVPHIEFYSKAPKKFLLFNEDNIPICAPNSKAIVRTPNSESLSEFLNGASKNFIDFVRQCLTWEKEKRLKPEEALLHPWILESLPNRPSKKKLRVEKKEKSMKNISIKSVKTSNFISYQMQSNKNPVDNKNGTNTKNTSTNTDKYSSPGNNNNQSK